jgi:hypothetical protein
MAIVGACREGAYRKEGGISSRVGVNSRVDIGGRVGIGSRVGIGASSNKDAFRPSRVPLLLYGALSIVYSGGVSK